MLTQEEALERLRRLRKSAMANRAYYDAWWTLAKVYDHGAQWGYINRSVRGTVVRNLRAVTDPRRTDLRVTVNRIHADVTKLVAATMPERIKYDLLQRSVKYKSISITGKLALDRHLEEIRALDVLREKDWARYVMGTGIVRRTLAQKGKAARVRDDLSIRNFRPGLATIFPHEIIRDPAANTLRPHENEVIYVHEKPRTTNWVARNFGVHIKTDATLGRLLEFQRQLQSAGAHGVDRGALDSREKAVIVYEAYYQDPDHERDWPWVLYGVLNPSDKSGMIEPLKPGLIPNPFFGLPFHHFHYDVEIQAPWARGVPHVLMQGQDIFNIGMTWMVRMMQEGSGKWRVQKGTMSSTEATRMLNNRNSEPLWWTKNVPTDSAPDRAPPPTINPAAADMINTMPDLMKSQVNLTDVQFGQSSKRGESAAALATKLAAANEPLEMIRRNDDLEIERLLYGMYVDLTNPTRARLDQFRKLVGPDIADSRIRELVRVPPTEAISSVKVHPSTTRPQTPADVRAGIVALHSAQVFGDEPSSVRVRWEAMLRGQPVDTEMKRNYDKQLIEIAMLVAGEDVRVNMSDNHDYHIRTVDGYVGQPAALALEGEQLQYLEGHRAEHLQAQFAETEASAIQQGPPEPGVPSPPGIPQQAGSVAPAEVA